MISVLLLVVGLGPQSVIACASAQEVCGEVALAPGADLVAEKKRCIEHGGTPRDICPRASTDATCLLGDTTLVFGAKDLAGADPQVRGGTIRGWQVSCHGVGGTFSLAGRRVSEAPPSAHKTLKLDALHLSATAASDCNAEEMLGTERIVCGGERRPELTVAVAAYDPNDKLGLLPKNPADALAEAREAASGDMKVTELKRTELSAAGTWRVTYRLGGPHGLPALYSKEVRKIGKALVVCTGTAFNERDHAEAQKVCASLRP